MCGATPLQLAARWAPTPCPHARIHPPAPTPAPTGLPPHTHAMQYGMMKATKKPVA